MVKTAFLSIFTDSNINRYSYSTQAELTVVYSSQPMEQLYSISCNCPETTTQKTSTAQCAKLLNIYHERKICTHYSQWECTRYVPIGSIQIPTDSSDNVTEPRPSKANSSSNSTSLWTIWDSSPAAWVLPSRTAPTDELHQTYHKNIYDTMHTQPMKVHEQIHFPWIPLHTNAIQKLSNQKLIYCTTTSY